jgi:hypothetical protein
MTIPLLFSNEYLLFNVEAACIDFVENKHLKAELALLLFFAMMLLAYLNG